jgi:hypothetical protein
MLGQIARSLSAWPILLGLLATPAAAGQVLEMTDLYYHESGFTDSDSVSFHLPDAGERITLKIEYSNLDLQYGSVQGFYVEQFAYFQEGMGVGNGYYKDIQINEQDIYVNCTTSNACLRIVRPGLAYASLVVPHDFTRHCTAETAGDCLIRAHPFGNNSIANLYLAFDWFDQSKPASLLVTLGDATAIPEPATWAMMIFGFGLAGSALRGRRSAPTQRPYA